MKIIRLKCVMLSIALSIFLLLCGCNTSLPTESQDSELSELTEEQKVEDVYRLFAATAERHPAAGAIGYHRQG